MKDTNCSEVKRSTKDCALNNKMKKYKVMMGRLKWLKKHTRPEIAIEVNCLH